MPTASVLAGLLLSAGSLSDRYGRRRLAAQFGLVIFGASHLPSPAVELGRRPDRGPSRHGRRCCGDLPDHARLDHPHLLRARRACGRPSRSWAGFAGMGVGRSGRLSAVGCSNISRGALIFLINVAVVAVAMVRWLAARADFGEDPGEPAVDAGRADPVRSSAGTALIYTDHRGATRLAGPARTPSSGSASPRRPDRVREMGASAADIRCSICRFFANRGSRAAPHRHRWLLHDLRA